MSETFNKQILLDNISYLVKERGLKIGELETAAGVSPGYISRVSKEGGSTPGIEFIANVACELKIGVDTLISVRLSDLTPTERYLIDFLQKLEKDTNDDKLGWERESAEALRNVHTDDNGFAEHVLFQFKTFTEATDLSEFDEVRDTRLISNTFDVHTYVKEDCFNLRLKNGARLYIISIGRCGVQLPGKPNSAKEIWIVDTNSRTHYLCSSIDRMPIGLLVDGLYTAVTENSKHPKIKQEVQYVINAYMNDDLSDDEKDPFSNLPF